MSQAQVIDDVVGKLAKQVSVIPIPEASVLRGSEEEKSLCAQRF